MDSALSSHLGFIAELRIDQEYAVLNIGTNVLAAPYSHVVALKTLWSDHRRSALDGVSRCTRLTTASAYTSALAKQCLTVVQNRRRACRSL
jgi:hypothetical protein